MKPNCFDARPTAPLRNLDKGKSRRVQQLFFNGCGLQADAVTALNKFNALLYPAF
jgi:hypothetical protein